jgi:CRISPR-associated endonuclease/helicase Cas3
MDECVGFCTERMTDNRSVLVICNTKSEARNLFLRMQRIAEENGWLIYHLSTAMCQRHRMTVLDEVQTNLCKPDKRVLCIATQLVEAGVDFSFQAVVRVLAGIDNLVQAVGRCNRSNEYDGLGNVYLINLKDENLSMLQEIYLAQTSTRQVLQGRKVNSEKMNAGNIDLDDQKAFLFYQCFFDELGENLKFPIPFQDKPLYLADLLANRVPDGAGCDSYALHQPFKIIAQNFQVLDKKNKDVIVPYKEGEALIEKLRKLSLDIKNGYKNFNMKLLQNILQETRRFTISIFDEQMKCLYEQGCLESLFDGRIFVLRKQAYHADYGLRTDHEPKVEDYMI